MDFKQEVIATLQKHVKVDVAPLLTIPPDSKMGDYAFPCFTLGQNPKEAAEKLKEKITLPNTIAKAEVMGPYLNFFINPIILAESILTEIYRKQKTYGQQKYGKGTIAMDYSHPNIAKPFSVGHLRSTVIGNCLYKTLKTVGFEPLALNYLGDWGTQFGKLIVAFSKWGNKEDLKEEPIKYLLKLYVKFHEEAEKEDSLNQQARDEFKKLEDGNPQSKELWDIFRELSLKEFNRIYDILGMTFDSYDGEASINKQVQPAIEEIKEKVKTEMSDGALIVDLEEYNMPPMLLLKSDGATTYHSRDMATAFKRLRKLRAQKLLYIVGSEQKLHFKQLFKVLEMMGYPKENFIHADFGLIRFPEGKMSTRKGRVIFLEDLLTKAIQTIEKIIEEKNPNLKNKKQEAEQVGVGAIIFADLSNERTRNINFDWDRMLSFDGETGPYIQYTHARACSILRNAKAKHAIEPALHISFDVLHNNEEQALLKHLYSYPEVLQRVSDSYKPHHLAQYLIMLSQLFNEFYHACPVLSDLSKQMKARVLLVDCVRQVLANGLDLMGIQAPGEM